MDRKLRFFIILTILVICLGNLNPDIALGNNEHISESGNVNPENTLIIANEMDARFIRDFSVLMNHLRLEWVILDKVTLPDAIQENNLILIGHPDSVYTGELMRELLTAEELNTLRSTADNHIILEKENPWQKELTIYICTGSSNILRRNATEEVLRGIIASAPPTSDWIKTTYEASLDENLRETMNQLQYKWEDAELPLEDLRMDMDTKSPKRISTEEAEEDIERMFYLFSHGYSGYAFFNQQGEFDKAKESILEELPTQSTWSHDAFSDLLYKRLNFIIDGHLSIGDHKFAKHQDFWYDTRLEMVPIKNGYQFVSSDKTYSVLSINNGDPASYLLPSLNQDGEPIYRIGLLSAEKPQLLVVKAAHAGKEWQFTIKLQRSDYDYYSADIFREEILGGIPVVRVRSFGDYYADQLSEFTQTASKYRDEAVIIVDIRGNGGGNEHWPISWIQGLTGRRAEAVFAFSELESKTSMMGRLNAFSYYYFKRGVTTYNDEVEEFTRIVNAFEAGTRQPRWTGPLYPKLPLIPNDTTVIVVTNGLVASAGEGLVMRISQLENVMVVGENTMGCLTFGNGSAYKLPHSGLMIWMPINFGLFPDQIFREEVGLTPDLWIPAADAVNYTVAALHRGTITTAQPMAQLTLEQTYAREYQWTRFIPAEIHSWLLIALFTLGAMTVVYFNRKNRWIMLGLGPVWTCLGLYMVSQRNKLALGYGFLSGGIIYLTWGIFSLWSAYRSPKMTAVN